MLLHNIADVHFIPPPIAGNMAKTVAVRMVKRLDVFMLFYLHVDV